MAAELPYAARAIRKAGGVENLRGMLSESEWSAFRDDWLLWQQGYQREPSKPYRRWVFRAGRGTGKTHTGARTVTEWARTLPKASHNGGIAVIGRTYREVVRVMVEGPSGILATAPDGFRPQWQRSNMRLEWPNGAVGYCYTADKPESMRGGNWARLWGDEIAHWHRADQTWREVIEPALRMGRRPRALLTTTPIRDPFLRKLEALPDTVVTRAATMDNAYLPRDVREGLERQYGGTRIGRQELYGEILDDSPYALWMASWFERDRVSAAPPMQRIVVSVDPAVSVGEDSDETGIVVCGVGLDGRGYVLEDVTCDPTAPPLHWAQVAVDAYHRWEADAIVAEINQGGEMVETTIRAVDDMVNVIKVRASRGKVARAEPVAALYERSLVSHVGEHRELEDQCSTWERDGRSRSPDRMDALVWGLSELMLGDTAGPISAYL